MRVAFDLRMLESSGIGRFIQELLPRLFECAREFEFILLGKPSSVIDKLDQWGVSDRSIKIVEYNAGIYSPREQLQGSWLFRRLISDVAFFPHYNVPVYVRTPFLVVVHDLTHLRFPEAFGRVRSALAGYVLAGAVRRASRVVTVSQASKTDIESHFPHAGGKVQCVPNGVSEFFKPVDVSEVESFKRGAGLPERYFVTVGNRKPHKNLAAAAEVIRRLRVQFPDLRWVVVGQRFKDGDAVDEARALMPGVLMEHRQLGDFELRMLYAGAQGLFMPSRWEGFGLPAAEAMACGCPVVASDIPALAEVVGEAGLLHAPDDIEGFTASLQRLLLDGALRERLSSMGIRRVTRFRWDTAAERIRELILEVGSL